MDKLEFNEILDFAVKREEEAIAFYQDLQQMVHFKEKKELLKEFESIERSHIAVLEEIRNNIEKKLNAPLPAIENLSISDYLVDVPPSEDMSYQDILITAMKREERANKLYSDLANQVVESHIKQLLMRLAGEESKHKLYFEKLYDDFILSEN